MDEGHRNLLQDAISDLPWYFRIPARCIVREASSNSLQRLFNIKFSTRLRKQSVRVSFSVFLKLQHQNRYFLVRVLSSRHPDSYAPFGGVVHHNRPSLLNQINFCPDPDSTTFADGPRYDEEDLRGVVLGKHVPALYWWYMKSSIDHEEPFVVLKRELNEELHSINLNHLCEQIGDLVFREVRNVPELIQVSGLSYNYQYRHLTVLEGQPDVNTTKRFADELSKHLCSNDNLILATHEEIMRGRTREGKRISSHSPYLFGFSRGRSDY